MKNKHLKTTGAILLVALIICSFSVMSFAAGDVAGAVENTWNAAKGQV